LPDVAGFSSAIFCFSASTSSYCDMRPRPISQSFSPMRDRFRQGWFWVGL
jgi:hypothetical protein